ncbi:hypothetical protein [Pontibacter pudoricolor]|uniref:hypothetical protein n=1 Tax=Pontibacter pudoricolor TaxID=2694930 RepID=UPI001390AA1D|nr:hypothetical protein [Pontibacter pudoricolor]
MRLLKFFAATVLAVVLTSCDNCEDVNLGKLEFTNEFISFLPAAPAQARSYYATFEGSRQQLHYVTPDVNPTVEIPVNKINYGGKFDATYCKEYYTADQKVYTSQIEGVNPLSISITYKKNASEERYNPYLNRDDVGDMIFFKVGYKNVFPEPITDGKTSYDSHTTQRWFILDKATTSIIDKYTYTQEFLPTVTLNGVEYENVYRFQSSGTNGYNVEDRFFLEKYPELDYIKGIYVKEGVGVIQAYSAKGKQVDITLE